MLIKKPIKYTYKYPYLKSFNNPEGFLGLQLLPDNIAMNETEVIFGWDRKIYAPFDGIAKYISKDSPLNPDPEKRNQLFIISTENPEIAVNFAYIDENPIQDSKKTVKQDEVIATIKDNPFLGVELQSFIKEKTYLKKDLTAEEKIKWVEEHLPADLKNIPIKAKTEINASVPIGRSKTTFWQNAGNPYIYIYSWVNDAIKTDQKYFGSLELPLSEWEQLETQWKKLPNIARVGNTVIKKNWLTEILPALSVKEGEGIWKTIDPLHDNVISTVLKPIKTEPFDYTGIIEDIPDQQFNESWIKPEYQPFANAASPEFVALPVPEAEAVPTMEALPVETESTDFQILPEAAIIENYVTKSDSAKIGKAVLLFGGILLSIYVIGKNL